MIEFDIDPEELKRLAAQLEQELKETQPPLAVPRNSDEPNEPSTRASGFSRSATDALSGQSLLARDPSSLSAMKVDTSTDRKARRWAELVTPHKNQGRAHFSSYLLTLASIALPFVVNHLLFGTISGPPSSAREEQITWADYWLKLALVGASVPLAISLYKFAKRLRAPNALTVMRKDPRPPVLLLRAFNDDHVSVSNVAPLSDWRRVGAKVGFERAVSFEELVYDLFSRCGPVIAIGRPGEFVPPLGASRFWVSDSRWQQAIQDLLNESQRVVLIMGQLQGREGLTWEARKVLSLERQEKAVFLMPPVEEREARSRWESYRDVSANRLPDYQGGELAVGFDGHGACQVVRVTPQGGEYDRDESAYRSAIRVPNGSRIGAFLTLFLYFGLWGSDFLSLLLPATQMVRESALRKKAWNNLQQLSHALHGPDQLERHYGMRVERIGEAEAKQHQLLAGEGLRITSIAPDSLAAQAGLQPGDLLLKLSGSPIPNNSEPLFELLNAGAGKQAAIANLVVYREENGVPTDDKAWILYALVGFIFCFGVIAVWILRRPNKERTIGYLDFQRPTCG